MVDITIRTQIQQNSLQKLSGIITRLTGIKFRNNFNKLSPVIDEAITKTVTDNSDKFIPNDSQAAELGIGQGGDFDFDKINNAWRALLPGGGFTTSLTRRMGTSRSSLIGLTNIDINVDGFLSAPISVIATPDSEEISEIKWMEWFLFGKTISGFRFSDRQPITQTSRTGRGIMINGGLWFFPMTQQRDFFGKLLTEVTNNINDLLLTNRAIRILKE